MALWVQKFGGTSVATTERIEAVAELIIRSRQAGHQVVAVVSAMAGETNRLLGLAQQIDKQAAKRELDVLASTGEQVTVALLAIALIKRGHPAISLLADQVAIRTDNKFGKARIQRVEAQRIQAELEQGHIVIVPGFQGRDLEGNLTTLGRGGSDTTAVAIAAALKADECQIFTDVDGVYTLDPRLYPAAKRHRQVPYPEMLELATVGAKVLHAPCVAFAGRFSVKLRVLSTFKPDEGTLMVYEMPEQAPQQVTGIALQQGMLLLKVSSQAQQQVIEFRERLLEHYIEVETLDGVLEEESSTAQLWVMNEDDFFHLQTDFQSYLKNTTIETELFQKNLVKLSVIGQAIGTKISLIAQIEQVLQQSHARVSGRIRTHRRYSVMLDKELAELAAVKLHQLLLS